VIKVAAVIPARLESTRFAGKVLYPFQGQPLLYHVWRQVTKAKEVSQVWIATDSGEIARAAESFGAEVIVTSRRPRTGTDRIAEAIADRSADIVINVQADCLGLKPILLDRVIREMRRDRSIRYATLARPIGGDQELFDPGVVKVVVDRRSQALWFSRFPLPYLQHPSPRPRSAQFGYLEHIGVYFFRRAALEAYAGWKRTLLEKAESLEQLRILENGGSIRVFRTTARTISVDKPEDLNKISGR
jgi:3-deoxy-manno-octulosonate cytidylyltransferase (CMP-KDO synthetase)